MSNIQFAMLTSVSHGNNTYTYEYQMSICEKLQEHKQWNKLDGSILPVVGVLPPALPLKATRSFLFLMEKIHALILNLHE